MKKIMFNNQLGLTQAALEGRKTMTRRIINDAKLNSHLAINPNIILVPVPESQKVDIDDKNTYFGIKEKETDYCYLDTIVSPYQIGEVVAIAMSYEYVFYELQCGLPDECSTGAGWKNKMFVKAEYMPCKIKITNIVAEQLQDISDEDCLKEGIYKLCSANGNGGISYSFVGASSNKHIGLYASPREAFAVLIDKISGKGTWERNPFVFVYEFELTN